MNILFVTPEYYVAGFSSGGGLGVYIKKTSAALAKRGHNITVVTFSNRSIQWSENGVEIKEVKILKNPWKEKRFFHFLTHIFFLWNRWQLRRRVNSIHSSKKFDVIQVSSYLSPGLFFPRKWPLVCRVSSIESLLHDNSGYPLKGLDHLYEWYEKKQLLHSRFIFSPSKFLAKKIFEYYNLYAEVIPTINPNFTEKQDLYFYNKYLKDKRYILYFGQMSRIKGTDILATALKKILEAIPDIYMVCIGRDDGLPTGMTCRQYLYSNLSPRYKNRLFIFKPLPFSQLIPCIQHSICVLQPSRIDNLPNACIETLSMKIPVIGSVPSSIEELVTDGINGLLFPNGDPNALAKCTIKFLKGETKLSALGLLSKNKKDYITQLENLYLKCHE